MADELFQYLSSHADKLFLRGNEDLDVTLNDLEALIRKCNSGRGAINIVAWQTRTRAGVECFQELFDFIPAVPVPTPEVLQRVKQWVVDNEMCSDAMHRSFAPTEVELVELILTGCGETTLKKTLRSMRFKQAVDVPFVRLADVVEAYLRRPGQANKKAIVKK